MSKGAPKGNQFWKLRSKHGRDKIFATPEIMLESCYEYFDWCDNNPLMEVDYRGANPPVKVELPKMRAYTLQGLTCFLDVTTVYFNQFESDLKGKEDGITKDFNKVIAHVREVIYNQKFTGAAAGFLNPNIIARDLGLRDESKIEHSGELNINDIDEARRKLSKALAATVDSGAKGAGNTEARSEDGSTA